MPQAALPIATLEHSLHNMLQVPFLLQFPPLLTLLDALFAGTAPALCHSLQPGRLAHTTHVSFCVTSVALPEEVGKWVVAILTLPVVPSAKRGRGAYLLHGATVAIAFALVGSPTNQFNHSTTPFV